MGPAELAELQPLRKGIPPWVGREVQNGLGSKDQHLPGSVRNFFFLFRPDPPIILNWIIHPPADSLVQNLQRCCTETS